VLEWTPAVTSSAGKPPLGLIFSAFMVCYMAGSSAVALAAQRSTATRTLTPAATLVALTAVALAAVLACYLMLLSVPDDTPKPPAVAFAIFVALCAFEACLGAYMPTIAALKAAHVPEDVRASVYSLFRVPLNAIVVLLLLVSLDSTTTFLICALLLAAGLAAAALLMRTAARRAAHPYVGELDLPSTGPPPRAPTVPAPTPRCSERADGLRASLGAAQGEHAPLVGSRAVGGGTASSSTC
jgi:hypothetical protein